MTETKQKPLRIGHLADIHIKNKYRVHDKAVFGKIYEMLRSQNLDLIAVLGDVFHDKTAASADNFMDVEEFLSNLVSIAPVILISGNHDTNIKLDGGPDLLTPVVRKNPDLQEPGLTYFRHSGIYVAHGIIWAVISPDHGHIHTSAEVDAKVAEFEKEE